MKMMEIQIKKMMKSSHIKKKMKAHHHALGPNGDLQGGIRFFSFLTGRVLSNEIKCGLVHVHCTPVLLKL